MVLKPERLAEIEAWLLNVVGRTAGSYREDIAELLAEVKRCHAQHQEPFACYQLAEGGWTCADTFRREELEAEVKRLRTSNKNLIDVTPAVIEKARLADELATALAAALRRIEAIERTVFSPPSARIALDRYDNATKEQAK